LKPHTQVGFLVTLLAGMQNRPDGVTLVDASGNALQASSWEGSFLATDGPATGMAFQDVGVSESSSTPINFSLQLAGVGMLYAEFEWQAALPDTFGDVNRNQSFSTGADCFYAPSNP